MVLQCYADESEAKSGDFALAGYLGTTEDWLKFSEEWEPLARHWGTLQNDGTYAFKMRDMVALDERFDRVPAFFRIIEKFNFFAFAVVCNRKAFNDAVDRVLVDWGDGRIQHISADLYDFVFHTFVVSLIGNADQNRRIFPGTHKIDFYFDDRSEKNKILALWDAFYATRKVPRRFSLGSAPRFENDAKFLPLQAADFLAYLSSHWAQIRSDGRKWFQYKRPFMMCRVDISTNDVIRKLIQEPERHFPGGRMIVNP